MKISQIAGAVVSREQKAKGFGPRFFFFISAEQASKLLVKIRLRFFFLFGSITGAIHIQPTPVSHHYKTQLRKAQKNKEGSKKVTYMNKEKGFRDADTLVYPVKGSHSAGLSLAWKAWLPK